MKIIFWKHFVLIFLEINFSAKYQIIYQILRFFLFFQKVFFKLPNAVELFYVSQGQLLEMQLLEFWLLETFFENVNCSTEKSWLLESG